MDSVMARPSWVVASVVSQRAAAALVRSRAWARRTARAWGAGAGAVGVLAVMSSIMPTDAAASAQRRARTDRSQRVCPVRGRP